MLFIDLVKRALLYSYYFSPHKPKYMPLFILNKNDSCYYIL